MQVSSRVKHLLLILVIALGLFPLVALSQVQTPIPVQAPTPTPTTILKVGVSLGDPFVIAQNGDFKGVAIDIWKQLADDEDIKYVFVPMGEHIDEAVEALATGKIDVLVGPIVVTYDRLKLVSFMQPYYLNQIGLVVHKRKIDFIGAFSTIFDSTILTLLIILIGFFIFYLHVFWYYEIKPKQPELGYLGGVTEAFWLHSLDIDLGQIPTHARTREVRFLWILMLALFFSSVTAAITSALTIALSDKYTAYNTYDEIRNKKIIGVINTAPYDIAKKMGLDVVGVNSREEAINMLLDKKAAAFVDYYPIADYYLTQQGLNHELTMSNLILQRNTFAFALPINSPLMHNFNLKLRMHQETGLIKLFCGNYFSNNEKAILNCEI